MTHTPEPERLAPVLAHLRRFVADEGQLEDRMAVIEAMRMAYEMVTQAQETLNNEQNARSADDADTGDDLDTLRADIGRKLDRLRGCGGSGGVSGGLEPE